MYRQDNVPELGQWDWLGKALDYTATIAKQVTDVKKLVQPAAKPAAKPAAPKAPISTAAKAAGGIGVGVLVAGAAVAAFLLFRKKGR